MLSGVERAASEFPCQRRARFPACRPLDFRAKLAVYGEGVGVAPHAYRNDAAESASEPHVVVTRHTHGHACSDDPGLVGSASDRVHVLRFPTYVRSRVRRLSGETTYPERGYASDRRSHGESPFNANHDFAAYPIANSPNAL